VQSKSYDCISSLADSFANDVVIEVINRAPWGAEFELVWIRCAVELVNLRLVERMIVQLSRSGVKVLTCGQFLLFSFPSLVTSSLRRLRTWSFVYVQIVKLYTAAVVACIYLITTNTASLTCQLVWKRTIDNLLRGVLVNSLVELFLTIVCNEIAQSVYFILGLLWAPQNVLDLGCFTLVGFPFGIFVTTKTRRSSCLRLVHVATSLRNAVTPGSLTFVCVVVVWIIDRCASVSKEVVYFLSVRDSRFIIPANRPHRELVNRLSLATSYSVLANWLRLGDPLFRRLVYNQISALSFTLPRSVGWCSSTLTCLISFCLREIN